jgi:hypothetical protein
LALDLSRARWRKSSHSGQGADCVEAAGFKTAVAVRDSKDPSGPALAFEAVAWQKFLVEVKNS